jgi:hypothetical protein
MGGGTPHGSECHPLHDGKFKYLAPLAGVNLFLSHSLFSWVTNLLPHTHTMAIGMIDEEPGLLLGSSARLSRLLSCRAHNQCKTPATGQELALSLSDLPAASWHLTDLGNLLYLSHVQET